MSEVHLVPPPQDDGPAILLVDDQRSGLIALRRLLEAEGMSVLEATSAHGAIAILESCPISVVVSDWLMPVKDGITLLDEVADRWPLCERLLYSGHFDAELVLEAHGSRHRAVSKAMTDVVVDTIVKLHRDALERLRSATDG